MSDAPPTPSHAPAPSWHLDALIFVGALGIVVLAALMRPSDEVLTLFGMEIPTVCTIRRLTGMSCPGCGLTRSFAYMAHGAVLPAFRMNLLGPVLFLGVAVQLPWRAVRLWNARRALREQTVSEPAP